MNRDTAIDTLLDLSGSILDQGNGYWIKLEAWRVDVSEQIPHGIRYLLTLHEPYGKQVMKSIVIGIMPQDQIRKRVLAIALGHYKPKASEPKVWFISMKSLAEVLSDDNRALLRVIAETEPESISALAQATGRKPGNLSRTLKTMSNYGIVDLKRERNLVRPIAKATEFHIVAA